MVRKPSTGEIIATSANQIVPLKFRGGTPDSPFPLGGLKGGLGSRLQLQLHGFFLFQEKVFMLRLTLGQRLLKLLASSFRRGEESVNTYTFGWLSLDTLNFFTEDLQLVWMAGP